MLLAEIAAGSRSVRPFKQRRCLQTWARAGGSIGQEPEAELVGAMSGISLSARC